MLEQKNIQNKKYLLGQFFTALSICKGIVDRIDFSDSLIIEPSFGSGNFLEALKEPLKSGSFYIIIVFFGFQINKDNGFF